MKNDFNKDFLGSHVTEIESSYVIVLSQLSNHLTAGLCVTDFCHGNFSEAIYSTHEN